MTNSEVLIVPTWDLIVLVAFIFFVTYSLILQKERILTSIVALYMALVVTQTWGDKVAAFFMGQNFIGSFWIKANLDPFWIKMIVFFGIIIFFAIRSDLIVSMQRETRSSLIFNLLYSLSYGTLLVASVITFLPEITLNTFILQSKLASFLYQHMSWWVILPVILIILGGYWNRGRREEPI